MLTTRPPKPSCLWRWNRHCSEMSAYKIQTPGNYPEESVQHSEQGGSFKSRIHFPLTNFIFICSHKFYWFLK